MFFKRFKVVPKERLDFIYDVPVRWKEYCIIDMKTGNFIDFSERNKDKAKSFCKELNKYHKKSK